VHRLRELLGANERGFRDYMTMLGVLSKNRDLQTQIQETQRMLTEIDGGAQGSESAERSATPPG